jgi:general secretion pathway protein I
MNQRGFTLLEAIVALVLITSTGMALLNWINTNLMTLQHVQQTYQRHEAMRNALAFMDTVNPQIRTQGKETVGIYTFRWRAQTVKLPRGGKGIYQISLYDTQVEVIFEKTLLARFTLRQVGFKQVYKPSDDWF